MNIDWRTPLTNFILHYVTILVGFLVLHVPWLGLDKTQAPVSITTFLVPVIIAGVTALITHFKLNAIIAKAKTLITQAAAQQSVPTAVNQTISPLAGITKAAMILICVGMVGFASGCSSDTATAYATRMTFSQGANDLTALHTGPAKAFSDQDFHTINTAEHAISPLLDTLDTAAAKADANKANIFAEFDYESIFSQVMTQLTPLLEKRSTVTNPTTQPSK